MEIVFFRTQTSYDFFSLQKSRIHLIQPLYLFLRLESAIQAQDPWSVSVCHMTLVAFLALEEDLTLFTAEQTDVVHLQGKLDTYNTATDQTELSNAIVTFFPAPHLTLVYFFSCPEQL